MNEPPTDAEVQETTDAIRTLILDAVRASDADLGVDDAASIIDEHLFQSGRAADLLRSATASSYQPLEREPPVVIPLGPHPQGKATFSIDWEREAQIHFGISAAGLESPLGMSLKIVPFREPPVVMGGGTLGSV